MSDDKIDVKIGADASGATAGMAEASAAVQGGVEKINASLGQMAGKIHAAAESVRTFQMRAKEFAEVYVAMFAVDKIAEFINKMGEASEKVSHLAQTFGMSTGQVQQLQGVAAATGMNFDAITRGIGIFDKNLVTTHGTTSVTAQAMAQLGITAKQAGDQMAIMGQVADKFKDMDDGPKKAALAMELFGRSGKEMIPFLNMGSEGIAKLNEKMAEYGVVNENAVAKGAALAESTNETRLGMLGVHNVLTDALAPTFKNLVDSINSIIKAFVASYKEGGIVADVFAAIAGIVDEVIAVFEALGEVFSAIWGIIRDTVGQILDAFGDAFGVKIPGYVDYVKISLNVVKDAIVILKDELLIALDVIGTAISAGINNLKTFANIAYDAFTLHWGSIKTDWDKGVTNLVAIVKGGANKVKGHAAEMMTAAQAMLKGDGVPGQKTGVESKAGGDFDPNLTQGPSVTDKWKTELQEALLQEKNWGADETAFSLAFWQEKIKQVEKGSKEELQIRGDIAKLKLAQFKTEQKDEIAEIKQTLAIKTDLAKSESGLAKIGVQEKIDAVNQAEKMQQISARTAAQARLNLTKQLYKIEEDESEAEYQLKLRALQDELNLQHLKPEERKKINMQIELVEAQHLGVMADLRGQHELKITELVNRSALERNKGWLQGLTQIEGAWTSTLQRMLAGQRGFAATMRGLWDGVVQSVTMAVAKMMVQWAIGLAMHKTMNQKEVLSDAKTAAAGAYKWGAGIGGPILGAVSAVAAFAGTMAYADASAEGGYDIPAGANPVTQLHQREMVLPAKHADVIRNLSDGGISPGGGTINIHVNAVDAPSVRRLFEDHGSALVKALKSQNRNFAVI